MKRLLLISLFVVFLFSNAHAFNPLVVCSGQGVASGGTPTTVTFGAYVLAGGNVDSHSGNTAITEDAVAFASGGPASDWTGFYVTITDGTGSGSALITGWDDDTDTITVGAGLSDVTDNDTFQIGCRYTSDFVASYCKSDNVDVVYGAYTEVQIKYYTTGPVYWDGLFYAPIEDNITASSITSAYLYVMSHNRWVASQTLLVGKMVDSAADSTAITAAATYHYRNPTGTVAWDGNDNNGERDVHSAVESDAESVPAGGNWINFTITAIVEDWEITGDDNIGMYMRSTYDNSSYNDIYSDNTATTSYRPFILITYE